MVKTELEKVRESTMLVVELLHHRAGERINEARQDRGADFLGVGRDYFDPFSNLTECYESLSTLEKELGELHDDLPRLTSLTSVKAVRERVWEIAEELSDIY